MTASVTADFKHEWHAEQSEMLRRRFLWYTGIIASLLILQTLIGGIMHFATGFSGLLFSAVDVVTDVASALMYTGAFLYVRKHRTTRDQLIRYVYWMIVANGAMIILTMLSLVWVTDESEIFPALSFVGILVTHLLAAAFLPWTPREAIRPLLPLLGLNAILVLVLPDLPVSGRIIIIALSPLVGVPGLLVAAWRHSSFRAKFQLRMLKGHYGEMKREFGEARQVHESLFPEPLQDGSVRFTYRYHPMRQIGGDYIFAHRDEDDVLNLVLIDVTGHGLSAALTVNRLAGEIERLLGENPEIPPGDMLIGLNNYVHLTLATHSVYATAICIRVDPRHDEIAWASAGHPPAFLLAVDGTLDRLESTAIVLGACHGSEFVNAERRMRFAPGDMVPAYTDGAIEVRNEEGRMLSIEGLQRFLASATPDRTGGWVSSLLREVDRFRHGPVQDDTLLVEIYRPLEHRTAAGAVMDVNATVPS